MNEMKIYIATSTIVKIILVLLAFYLLYVLRDVALLLIASVVIAAAVEPATRWFLRHRVPRLPAVITVYLAGLTFLAGIIYFVVPPFISELLNFTKALPEYGRQLDLLSQSQNQNLLGQLTENISFNDFISQIRNIASDVTGGLFQALSSAFGGLLSFLLVLVISFYLAAQEKGVENFLKLVTPGKSQVYVIDLWHRAQKKIGLWLQGQLLLGLIIGVLVYFGLVLVGVPNALLLAIIAGVFELIPVFGPILAAVPAVLIGFTVSPTVAALTVGLYVIIQQFENYLIQPMVVQKVVGISPLIAIISLIIGGQLAGFLGVLLSVPVAAVIMEFIGDVSKERSHEIEEAQREQDKKNREEEQMNA